MILMTTAEVAAIYHVPASTIRRWFGEQRLTAHGTGYRRLWDVGEVDQLVELLRAA